MDIRERHFGRISTEDVGPDGPKVDIDVLVRRLILFEQCIIETNMLKEIPTLIAVFGARGFLDLIESGVIRVVCDALTAGQAGQTFGLESTGRRGRVLPYGSYRFVTVGSPGMPNRQGYVDTALREVDKADISNRHAKKIRAALANSMLVYPPTAGQAGVQDTESEVIARQSTIVEAIRRVVLEETGQDVGNDYDFKAEYTDHETDIRVETDLSKSLRISVEQQHKLIERAILAVAGLNQRIYLMESFEAVTGLQTAELPLFEDKVRFLVRQFDPEVQEERLDRVITVGNLPRYSELPLGTTINVGRLMRLRNDSECVELRRWLRSLDAESDEEINRRFDSVRQHMSALIESEGGRAVRFVITSGAGAIPVAGLVAGPAATAADSFLLERVIGKPGPAVFLSRRYPRIFK